MTRKKFSLNKSTFNKISSLPHLVIFCVGFLAGFEYYEFDKGQWLSVEQVTKEINVCFTPPAGCGSLIAKEIHQAKESIYMQAFSFTSEVIAEELIKAHMRGVKVQILFDRGQIDEKNSKFHTLRDAGLDIKLDHAPGLAHNKIVIIDRKKVITGSYNFTRAADKRNADNVIMVDNSEVASAYLENWQRRYEKSR
jgi:phospholipase D